MTTWPSDLVHVVADADEPLVMDLLLVGLAVGLMVGLLVVRLVGLVGVGRDLGGQH